MVYTYLGNYFNLCWHLLETSQPWPLLLWLRNSLLSKADAMSDQVPCTQCTFLNIETYLSYESGLGLTKLANHSVRRLVLLIFWDVHKNFIWRCWKVGTFFFQIFEAFSEYINENSYPFTTWWGLIFMILLTCFHP